MNQHDFLKAQILGMDRMLALSNPKSLSSLALQKRRLSFVNQLAELDSEIPKDAVQHAPCAVIAFDGGPVRSFMQIEVQFAGKALSYIQDIVKTLYAWQKGGSGARGRQKGEAESLLFLTGLVPGSFGFELQGKEHGDMLEKHPLKNTLEKTAQLLDASRSDASLNEALDKYPIRAFASLTKLLDIMADSKASVKMLTGNISCVMSESEVMEARNRITETSIEDTADRTIDGTLKGLFFLSGKFEFITEDGIPLTGVISEDLSEDDSSPFLTKKVKATFIRTLVRVKGVEKVLYELTKLEELPLSS